ncbi:MAG: squalene--hopene cyclase [Pseudomonadota bacterium]|nr:squalene--hopene cyclase [Pseudomonadota bacterium]
MIINANTSKPWMNTTVMSNTRLQSTIKSAQKKLLSRQKNNGYWEFELEADTTISSEYILLNHFLGEINENTEKKIAVYLRNCQETHGGWPLFHGGDFDMSASVKAYFALKLTGDSPDEPHMKRAREAILAHGGAVNCNVFTRITLALFRQIPWRATPVTRVEIMFAPSWFPIHINKVSYWTRTVTVPLLILTALKPSAKNPLGVSIDELFHKPPYKEDYVIKNPTGKWIGSIMLAADRVVRPLEPLIPNRITNKAIELALEFITERLNDNHGLGGIFPAMVNSLMAFRCLGYGPEDPLVKSARAAIDSLLIFKGDKAFCQPCESPVWDTGLAVHALVESNSEKVKEIDSACEWLRSRQILNKVGDWSHRRKSLSPGGWAFQYRNDHYPDVDDTAVVAMALNRYDPEEYHSCIRRAENWIIGMQSKNGGWAAFDAENEYYILENMPFADHGALLDPPSVDVTARCISFLSQIGYAREDLILTRALSFLKEEQESDGSWFGRWGTNYIYGTWSVLSALKSAGEDMSQNFVLKAVEWLKIRQKNDGGWGENCSSYWPHRKLAPQSSLPSQTAWAVLALIAADEGNSEATLKGISHLLNTWDKNNGWQDQFFNAVGFPRVFYLKYHGYSQYFPLLALKRYQSLRAGTNSGTMSGI